MESKKEILDQRNSVVDIEKIVKDVVKVYNTSYGAKISTETENTTIEYFAKNLTFSLNKLIDTTDLPAGAGKSIIEKIKKAVNDAGFGKTGNAGKSSSRAQQIDKYLSQKHIGPIKR
jgi:hypothetical protein